MARSPPRYRTVDHSLDAGRRARESNPRGCIIRVLWDGCKLRHFKTDQYPQAQAQAQAVGRESRRMGGVSRRTAGAWRDTGGTSRGMRRHVRGFAAAWSTLGSASLAAGSDVRRTRVTSRGMAGVGRRTADASRDVGGTSRGTGDAWRGAGGTSQRTGDASRGMRTVAFAPRSDARRARGRALALRGASVVCSFRIAPIASDIATKTSACSRKTERSARGAGRVSASVSGCSRDSDCIPTNGERCTTPFERCETRRERWFP